MPHSLGLLYETVTSYLGFLHSSDEYTVMALASTGSGRYLDRFREFVRLGEDGGYTVTPVDLVAEFGPARRRGEPLERRYFDVAAARQTVLEEAVLNLVRWLADGVAVTCVMNARLRNEGPFSRIFVQPAAGDAGRSLGAAAWVDARARCGGAVRDDTCLPHPRFSDERTPPFATTTVPRAS